MKAKLEHGTFDTLTLDNVRGVSTFRRGPYSGWYVSVALPLDVLEAEARSTQRGVLIVALFVVLLSAASTVFYSARIKRAIRASSEGAAVLARGEIPDMKRSRISELEDLRRSLVSASELLRSRERAKSDFLANMSHELRTPLGIVLGMTDLLSKDDVAPEDRARSWEIVKRNGRQLLRLIDDILDVSKVDAKSLTIEGVDFSLNDLTSSIVEDFTPRARENGIEIKFVRDAGSRDLINSDPVRVRQVVSNLVGNAVKFTHQGVVTVRHHSSPGDLVRLTVSDTGIGLDENQRAKLFTAFSQGDETHSRRYGGTGLGLSLSRKLAQLLGGDVVLLESRPGEGSVFEFTFRPNPSTAAFDARVVETRARSEHGIPKGTRILLAEDSADNVALIETYLKRSGAQVSIASNGIVALELVEKGRFDLILMDIQMPDMDGYEATRIMRERGVTTPIVALTAHALDEHRSRALSGGFSDYLTKPIPRDALIETIERNLSL